MDLTNLSEAPIHRAGFQLNSSPTARSMDCQTAEVPGLTWVSRIPELIALQPLSL